MVTNFNRAVGALIQGEEASERLIQRCRPAYIKLKCDIRGTAPRFVPFMRHEGQRDFEIGFEVEPRMSGEDDTPNEDQDLSEIMYLDDVRKHIERFVTFPSPVSQLVIVHNPGP